MNERQPIVFSRELDRAVIEADPDNLIMSNLDLATRVALWFWRRKTKEVPLEELQAQALLTLGEERENPWPLKSGDIIQKIRRSGYRHSSQPEAWVIRHEKNFELERQFVELMGSIELSWIEGFVLYHHFFRRLSIADVADMLGKSIPEATANRDSLIRKAAVALGYVTAKEAGIKLVMIEDEIIVRQREVKKLWSNGYKPGAKHR